VTTYVTQEQMLERIDMLEKAVAMLVRITVNNWTEPEARTALTLFADRVIDDSMRARIPRK
jgi:hypothetical protein